MNLPLPNPGDRISANLIREIIRAIRSLTPVAGRGMRVSRGPNGTVYDAGGTRSVASAALGPFPWKIAWCAAENDGEGAFVVYLPQPGSFYCADAGITDAVEDAIEELEDSEVRGEPWKILEDADGETDIAEEGGTVYLKISRNEGGTGSVPSDSGSGSGSGSGSSSGSVASSGSGSGSGDDEGDGDEDDSGSGAYVAEITTTAGTAEGDVNIPIALITVETEEETDEEAGSVTRTIDQYVYGEIVMSARSENPGPFEIAGYDSTSGTFTFENCYYQTGGRTLETVEFECTLEGGSGIIALKVGMTPDTSTEISFETYESMEELTDDQEDLDYAVVPLYEVDDGVVTCDFRKMPNFGAWESV